METESICAAVEAILFVSGDPVERSTLTAALEISDLELETAAARIAARHCADGSGLKLLIFADKLQLCSRAECADYVERALAPAQKHRLSNALLETLSVVAYRQPITKSELETIRGVKCDYSISVLTRLGLIREAGRKEALGRPILYGTTDDFLRHIGVSSLSELPRLAVAEDEEFTEPL